MPSVLTTNPFTLCHLGVWLSGRARGSQYTIFLEVDAPVVISVKRRSSLVSSDKSRFSRWIFVF